MESRPLIRLAFLGVLASALTGCADQPRQRTAATVAVRAAEAGFKSDQRNRVTAVDPDGTTESFSWPADVSRTHRAEWEAFEMCLLQRGSQIRLSGDSEDPHAVSAEIGHCIDSSGVPHPDRAPLPDALKYKVSLFAGDSFGAYPPPGVPATPLSNGSRFLGVKRLVSTTVPDSARVKQDAEACKDAAAAKGVINWTSINGGSDSGFRQTFSETSIKDFVDRFDHCLEARGYMVEDSKW